ncbi:hypothetical protein Q7C36_003202 [Tachysurus vachellii]|uniref:Uncharacterized protein n=1 Tax=Tachysurus vachellii TaxID=175792 RepID=A0AA88NPL4_TACVA|nr:hypothetical protein Q7C36_003202 [Tachysurus vachellii]
MERRSDCLVFALLFLPWAFFHLLPLSASSFEAEPHHRNLAECDYKQASEFKVGMDSIQQSRTFAVSYSLPQPSPRHLRGERNSRCELSKTSLHLPVTSRAFLVVSRRLFLELQLGRKIKSPSE